MHTMAPKFWKTYQKKKKVSRLSRANQIFLFFRNYNFFLIKRLKAKLIADSHMCSIVTFVAKLLPGKAKSFCLFLHVYHFHLDKLVKHTIKKHNLYFHSTRI